VGYPTTDYEDRTATTEHPVAGIRHGRHSGKQAAGLGIVRVAKELPQADELQEFNGQTLATVAVIILRSGARKC